MKKEFMVYSVDECGREGNEGTFPTEASANEYAQQLADNYGPTHKQDIDIGNRIMSISIRPIWVLNSLT